MCGRTKRNCSVVDRRWKQPSVQPRMSREADGHILTFLTVNTTSFLCTAFQFGVRLSCASPCRICCQLLCIKIFIMTTKNNNETNNDGYYCYYYNYCISLVYVADLYWLFATVEQNSCTYPPIQCVYSLSTYCIKKPLSGKLKVISFDGYDLWGETREKKKKQIWKMSFTVVSAMGKMSVVYPLWNPCVLFSVFL